MSQFIATFPNGATLTWEVQPGLYRVGRGPDNNLRLEEGSVSTHHAELIVESEGVRFKDLHSTNGTCLGGQRVSEGVLRPGQTLQLGGVALRYEPDHPQGRLEPGLAEKGRPFPGAGESGREGPAVSSPSASDLAGAPVAALAEPVAAVRVVAGAHPCRYHGTIAATFVCGACHSRLCPACVVTRPRGGKDWHFCPVCKSECQPIPTRSAQQPVQHRKADRSFYGCIGGAFGYPFARGGVWHLVFGTLVFSFLDFASFVVRFAGGIGMVASVILFVTLWGYLFGYMQRVITATANGEDRLPGLPEISDWSSDLLRPCLMLVVTVGVCFGPAMAYAFLAPEPSLMVWLPLIGWGVLYFPMALLALAMSDDFLSLNPFLVLPTIARIPLAYLVTCIILAVLMATRILTGEVLTSVHRLPLLLTGLLVGFIGFYFVTVQMRILGLMYFANRHRIGWYK